MEVEEMFRKSGALLEGHFLLTSGLHSPVYWEKFRVMQYPDYVQQLCGMIADHFRDRQVQVVAGPTTGGIILAYETGKQLGVRSIFAEKDGEAGNYKVILTYNGGTYGYTAEINTDKGITFEAFLDPDTAFPDSDNAEGHTGTTVALVLDWAQVFRPFAGS